MNILHISDLHFGPRHWKGNNDLLLEKLNSDCADLVINTGDSTTDSLESEFESAGQFLNSINCTHLFSIMGNHDKRNLRSHELFREFIDDVALISPLDLSRCSKKNIYLDPSISALDQHVTDINTKRTKKVIILTG